jgi:pyruvate dehydrogenase E1 component
MIPFYAYYSMFGFQRVGDALWGASDAGARGFLLGATAGRTTLPGEGLQHQDGHSHVLASTIPACEAYDPAFAYEMATIIERGIRRMYGDMDDVFYYLTLYNEPYIQPAMPDGSEDGILDGLYKFADAPGGHQHGATILFSGPAHAAARAAQAELSEHFDVGAELWSATSYKKLREEAMATVRWNRLHPEQDQRIPRVAQALEASPGPIVAVTDYMRAVPDQIAPFMRKPYATLGTDGYGRSDTREALRSFFEVDAPHVVVAVLTSLVDQHALSADVVGSAIGRYGIDPAAPAPWTA